MSATTLSARRWTVLRTTDRPVCDVIIQGHGSVILIWPQNDNVKWWIEENVYVNAKWGEGIVCEPRYISPIVEALLAAGYTVES